MKCIKTRGKKGEPHLDPDDPPRRRANKARGHGKWETDRPPILGVVGRDSGNIYLEVCENSTRETLEPKVLTATSEGTTINSDEWCAYNQLADADRVHKTVCHSGKNREWARDDDADGIREVHNNTMEGIWTGLRNFLRIFRGVHKKYLNQYAAMFEWGHNCKSVTLDFLRILCGVITPNAT